MSYLTKLSQNTLIEQSDFFELDNFMTQLEQTKLGSFTDLHMLVCLFKIRIPIAYP